MTADKYISETLKNELKAAKTPYNYKQLKKEKMMGFRQPDASVIRIEKPSNLPRAKKLGYKAKKGVIVARVRVRKGSGAHKRPRSGRKPKRMGTNKLTRNISIQRIAEGRAGRKFPNCEVLNSYWAGEDGKHKYYEVILLEPAKNEIKKDPALKKITSPKNRGRANRGLTSNAKKQKKGRAKKGN